MKRLFLTVFLLVIVGCKKNEENVEPAPTRENTYFRIVNAADNAGTLDLYQLYYNVLSKIGDSLFVSKSLPQNQYLKSQVPDEKTMNDYPQFVFFFTAHPSEDTTNYKSKFENPQLKANAYQTFFLAEQGGNTVLLRFEDNVSFVDSLNNFALRLVNLDPSASHNITITPADTNIAPTTLSAGSFNASGEIKLPQGKYTVTSGGTSYTLEAPKKKYIQFVITATRKFILY